LNDGLGRKLTLVSAPAGFGKTTLVSAWVALLAATDPTMQVAWLSLDESDHDLTRFLTDVVAALERIAPTIGARLLPVLQSTPPLPTEAILTALLNELVDIENTIVLVLDDYHLTDSAQVDSAVSFFLEHLPQQNHVVMTTREDPALPLARLRARDQLAEVRAKELRFQPDEAAAFLNQVMALRLTADEIALLEQRTEGWIAGLQLAALSMQQQDDIPGFLQLFAGDHRYIVDYLTDEVLDRQPEAVRRFLLQTAILDRLTGPLCDAVTDQPASSAQLAALEQSNFFIVPLDQKRQWYRYHHLFRDVLHARLLAEHPEQVRRLHQRASDWYARQEMYPEAIRHALAAEDYPHAADWIERIAPMLRQSRQETTLLAWLRALPEDVLRYRPVLSAFYAGTLLLNGALENVEQHLQNAERWLAPSVTGMIVIDREEFRNLAGSVAVYRAAIAYAAGHVTRTATYARQALERTPADAHLMRGSAAGFLALADWWRGDLDASYASWSECRRHMRIAGHLPDAVGCSIALGDLRTTQGRLREAFQLYEQGWQLATESESVLRGSADMLVGMSQIYLEQNDLEAAVQALEHSQALGDFAGLPQNPYRWRVAMARVCHAQGDLTTALRWLGDAERVFNSDFYPVVHPISAWKARILIAQGRLEEAADWARDNALTPDDALSYVREFEHLTLARLLLAQAGQIPGASSPLDAVMHFLEQLYQAASAGARTASLIEIRILQALACQRRGDVPSALKQLDHALQLAEPEQYARLFIDEGQPMAILLEAAAKHGIATRYVRRLQAMFSSQKANPTYSSGEPLSEREFEVLRLLHTDLSGPEIAKALVVSLSTLRTHTRNIYSKLGVNNRRAAVRVAEELGLF
jgi:LuxR family maltose regulon positive regulatory protein